MMQVQSFKLRGFKPFSGVTLRRGAARVLVYSIPVDYVLDGYRLLLGHRLTTSSGEAEQQVALVLQLKGVFPLAVPPYPLDSDHALFSRLHETQEFIAIYLSEDSCVVGRVHRVSSASFHLQLLSTTGQWLEVHPFRFERIKIVEAGTDYLHSLHLLAAHNEGVKAA
jgi:hypothetical protein